MALAQLLLTRLAGKTNKPGEVRRRRKMADSLIVKHAEDVLRVVHGSEGTAAAPSTVESSWSRCVNRFHLDPSRLYLPTVVDSNLLKDRQARNEELVEI